MMDVDIMKVENFDGIFFPESSESRLDFSKVDFFLGKTTTKSTLQDSDERKNVSTTKENTPNVSVEHDEGENVSVTSPTMTIDIDYLSEEDNLTTIEPTTIIFEDEPTTVILDYEDESFPSLGEHQNITDTKSEEVLPKK